MQDSDLQGTANDTSGGPAPSYDPYAQIRAIYQSITGGKYSPTQADLSQFGTNIDSTYLSKIQAAVGNWWQQYQAQNPAPKAADTPAPSPAPSPSDPGPQPPGPGQTPPDIYNAPLTKPFSGTFGAPTASGAPAGISVDLGGPQGINYIPQTPSFTGANAPPTLTPPGAWSYADFQPTTFTAPSVADALNDPGYQFRVKQGSDALQNWAAARGTLNDSSTAKSLEDYGQDAASQEYSNVWNRALSGYQANEGDRYNAYLANRQGSLQAYNTNYQTQVTDPYQAKLSDWMTGIVNPANLAYSTQAAAGQNQNTLNYANAWTQYLNTQDQYNNWQDRTWQKILQGATA